MWKKLEKMDWTSLKGVDGQGVNAGGILRLLASSDAGSFGRGLERLYDQLFPRETFSPALVALLPFLIRLLKQPGCYSPLHILTFLAQVAQRSKDMDWKRRIIPEQSALRRLARAHVISGFSDYLPYLSSGVEGLQEAALLALAWCGEDAVPPLEAFIQEHWEGLGHLPLAFLALGRASRDSENLFLRGLAHISNDVKLSAGLGFVLARDGHVPRRVLNLIRSLIMGTNHYPRVAKQLRVHCDALGTPDAYLRPLRWRQFRALGWSEKGFQLHPLLEQLPEGDPARENLADLFLHWYLAAPPQPARFRQAFLSPMQREMLRACLDHEAAWDALSARAAIVRDDGPGPWWEPEAAADLLDDPEPTRMMVLNPSWEQGAKDLCASLGRQYWCDGVFVFFEGDVDALGFLAHLDPYPGNEKVSEDSLNVATRLYHAVVKGVDFELSNYSFYSFISRRELMGFCRDFPWVHLEPPPRSSGDSETEDPD